jgi:hypothetical protein
MTETAKRRPGRPKGSRNRPRSAEPFVHPPLGVAALRETTDAAVFGDVEKAWPRTWEQPALVRPAIRVTLITKVAMSARGPEIEIDWPTGMPFPVVGDRVVTPEASGWVGGIEYHPADRRIVLSLR